MVRYVSIMDIATETVFSDKVHCYEQIWGDGKRWTAYLKKPRHTNGLSLICSPVEVRYTLPDGTKFSAGQGDVVYLPNQSAYSVSFHKGGKDVDIYTINFLIYDSDGNEIRFAESPRVFHGGATQPAIAVAAELSDACLLSGSALKKQALLLRLLDVLHGFFERHSEDFYPIRRGVTLLMKEWDKNEKIAKYAQECGISERNFYACFKKWCGKTPVDYRNEIRMTAAASLLKRSNLSVAEIAFKTGFEDPYYFSRIFKKTVGISPIAYRKKENAQ